MPTPVRPSNRRNQNPIDRDAADMRGADDDEETDELDGDDDEEGDELEGDDDGDDDDGDELGDGEFDGLRLGPPFAISGGLVIEQASAIVRHEDGRRFKINLADDRVKTSPHTKERFTHVLLIVPEDDDQIVGEVVQQVIAANGLTNEHLQQMAQGAGGKRNDDDIPEG